MRSPKKPSRFRGYVQVYTGNGKGKTTAALGLALRAAGHGYRTYIGQFLKGRSSGEQISAKKLGPLLTIEPFGAKKFVRGPASVTDGDIRRAEEGLRRCLASMLSGEFRIVVLDEINVALGFGLITAEAVHEFLDRRPADVEVVLTGRGAPASIVKRADLVTVMESRRHYYALGVRARKGIED